MFSYLIAGQWYIMLWEYNEYYDRTYCFETFFKSNTNFSTSNFPFLKSLFLWLNEGRKVYTVFDAFMEC